MDNRQQNEKLTPMVRQYREIKSRHRDKLLLFRLGDFYELFDEDAREASTLLNLTLTSRNDMPMCGFPYHAAKQYIMKIVQAGRKAAICEQLEDPAKAKGIVKRDIVSVITPGTLVDDDLLGKPENNYLCVVYGGKDSVAMAFADVSTGEFFVAVSEGSDVYREIQDELARFAPSEILYNEGMAQDAAKLRELERAGALTQACPEWFFEKDDLAELPDVPPEAAKNPAAMKSISGAMRYLAETQLAAIKNIREVKLLNANDIVELDDFTIRNLELVSNMQDGGKKFTLLDVLDETVTPMGGRMLRKWILLPLTRAPKIYERLNRVETFVEDGILLSSTRELLKSVSDLERLTSRIALRKAAPSDLDALARSLAGTRELRARIEPVEQLKGLAEGLVDLSLVERIVRDAIDENPTNLFGNGVIRPGYSPELDELRSVLHDGKNWILKLQSRERERTGINSMKIKYNKVFGYFIEVSNANKDSVPADYIRKQSLVNAERYTLPELSEYEMKVTTAGEKVESLEKELFDKLVEEVAKFAPELQRVAGSVAEADVLSSLANVAAERRYVKPVITDDADFAIRDGRHPVVEKYMGADLFVPNDVTMDPVENRILIVTGPNMAGKSTYLRQNALIALMAQMGSYVPAREAGIGVIDKIFTRIGASDELSAGRSTFLVEMEEAANIVRNATPRSLIIMDELGRGTSTYDGLSIAWAVVEFLHEHPERSGKTLFATHYHELTRLGEKKGIKNYNIAVREYRDELVFLRKVVEGAADRSYGIYVAKLAGLDEEIIGKAKTILASLESEGDKMRRYIEKKLGAGERKKAADELELFADDKYNNVIEKIKNTDINRITPLEAITFLAEIKKEVE